MGILVGEIGAGWQGRQRQRHGNGRRAAAAEQRVGGSGPQQQHGSGSAAGRTPGLSEVSCHFHGCPNRRVRVHVDRGSSGGTRRDGSGEIAVAFDENSVGTNVHARVGQPAPFHLQHFKATHELLARVAVAIKMKDLDTEAFDEKQNPLHGNSFI